MRANLAESQNKFSLETAHVIFPGHTIAHEHTRRRDGYYCINERNGEATPYHRIIYNKELFSWKP